MLTEQQAGANRAFADAVIERYPDAHVTMNDDTVSLIEIIKDGYLYSFRARMKNGRFKFSAKPVTEPLTAPALLGVTEANYTRLLGGAPLTGEDVEAQRDGTARESPAGGRIRVYATEDALLVTCRDLPEGYALAARFKTVAKVMSELRKNLSGAAVRFDDAMKIDLINYSGVDAAARLDYFDGDTLAGEQRQEPDEGSSIRDRIPGRVRAFLRRRLGEYVEGHDAEEAARFLFFTINPLSDDKAQRKANISMDTIRKALAGESRSRWLLLNTAVLAHYAGRWVETSPHSWKFITGQDVAAACKEVEASLQRHEENDSQK